MIKVKKGDKIIVTIGKDKGKTGKVETVLPQDGSIIVPGINMYKRHMKKRDEKQTGGIVDKPRALSAGKYAVVCPSCNKPTRVGFLVTKNDKVRICVKCKAKI